MDMWYGGNRPSWVGRYNSKRRGAFRTMDTVKFTDSEGIERYGVVRDVWTEGSEKTEDLEEFIQVFEPRTDRVWDMPWVILSDTADLISKGISPEVLQRNLGEIEIRARESNNRYLRKQVIELTMRLQVRSGFHKEYCTEWVGYLQLGIRKLEKPEYLEEIYSLDLIAYTCPIM